VNIDGTNGNQFVAALNALLIVYNPSGSPRAFEIESQPDPQYQRTGDVNLTIAAGALQVFRLTEAGWADGDGMVNISGHSALMVGVVIAPNL